VRATINEFKRKKLDEIELVSENSEEIFLKEHGLDNPLLPQSYIDRQTKKIKKQV
jgi:hypothetical protein